MDTAVSASRLCPRCQAPIAAWAKGSVCTACMVSTTTNFGAALRSNGARAQIEGHAEGELEQPLVFGDYLLERQINHGGMGVVYRARQLSLNRTVAVKLLLLGRYSSDESRMRFRREAQSAAQLRHPHIVAVYEVGECEEQPFIAMEYVDGGSLADRVRESPLTPRRAAQLMKVVAEAIHYAHQHGVLHRDVKPSNLLIDADEKVHVSDFGLAKQLDGTSDVTLSGRMLGTPNYLPPEAISGSGDGFGIAGDVYSLGAVLYEALTGRPPFLSGSLPETLRRIAENDPASLRSLSPSVPRDLETICLKALAKDPARRFASAKDLADEIGRWLADEPILTRPAGWSERLVKWARRKPAIAALAALTTLAVSGAMGTLMVANYQISGEKKRVEAARSEAVSAQFKTEQARKSAESAKRTAEASAAAHRRSLVHFQITEGASLLEQHENFAAMRRFAEAARLDEADKDLAKTHRRRFAMARRSGAQLEQLWKVEGGEPSFASFDKEGKRVAWISQTEGVRIVDVETGAFLVPPQTPEVVKTQKAIEVWFGPEDVMWVSDASGRLHRLSAIDLHALDANPLETALPDHKRLVSKALHFSEDGSRFIAPLKGGGARIFNAKTGLPEPLPLLAGDMALQGARLSHDGQMAAVYGTDGCIQVVNTADGKLVTSVQTYYQGLMVWVEFLPSGNALAAAGRYESGCWNLQTGRSFWRRRSDSDIYDARLSAGGSEMSIATGRGTTVILDTLTGAVKSLPAAHLDVAWTARFSPSRKLSDGEEITTVATASNDTIVRLSDTETGRAVSTTLPHGDLAFHSQFSPDGTRLLTTGREPFVRLWKLPARDGSTVSLDTGSMTHLSLFSPDRKTILTTRHSTSVTLWKRADGKELRTLSPAATLRRGDFLWAAAFDPAGKRFVLGFQSGEIQVRETETGELVRSFNLNDADLKPGARPVNWLLSHASFSPDGNFLIAAGGVSAKKDGTPAAGIVRRWRMLDGSRLEPDLQHASHLSTVILNKEGSMLLTASLDRTAVLWNFADGAQIFSATEPCAVTWAGFSPDERSFATSCSDGEVLARPAQVWDIARKGKSGAAMFQTDGLYQAEYSPDGKLILTTGEDGEAMLWNAADGTHAATLPRGRNQIRKALFSRDGSMILTCGDDSQVWETATREPVTAPLTRRAAGLGGWSEVDDQVMISSDSNVGIWDLSPAVEPLELLRAEAEMLSCERTDAGQPSSKRLLTPDEILQRWELLQRHRKQTVTQTEN